MKKSEKKTRGLFAALLCVALILCACTQQTPPEQSEETQETQTGTETQETQIDTEEQELEPWDTLDTLGSDYTGKTVILHSNDVHGEIMGYAYIAAARDAFESKGADVILADAGDFSQGDPNVSLSKGADAVAMMNAVGYDIVTLGNHEFDFGYEQLKSNLDSAEFKIICADVFENGETILDPNWMYENDETGLKIGFFGMETPETQTKVNPGLIQGITFLSNTNAGDENLYTCAQAQIDELRENGADVVIALTHLGVDDESAPDGHRSLDLYNNTNGIDIMLDGHSHTR